MPRDCAGFFLVTSERLQVFLEVPQVEQLQQMISRRRYQPVAVVIPLQVHHRRLVSVKRCQSLTAFGIPEFDRLLVVLAAGNYQRLRGMPVNTFDVCTVPTHDSLLLTTKKIENPQRSVVAAGNKFRIRGAEAVDVGEKYYFSCCWGLGDC